MSDNDYGSQWESAAKVEIISASDVDEFDVPTQGISWTSAITGDVRITDAKNNITTFPTDALSSGTIQKLRIKKLWATGTTASGAVSGFVGYW
jgi:hypothetical protein